MLKEFIRVEVNADLLAAFVPVPPFVVGKTSKASSFPSQEFTLPEVIPSNTSLLPCS